MSFTNPNPNEPHFPYGGGSDNPGDNTGYTNPGGGVDVETGLLSSGQALDSSHERFVPVLPGLAPNASDTNLKGLQAVPPTSAGFDVDAEGADTGGPTVDPVTGNVREPGQDEVVGETETTTGESPSAFPEVNP
jgi:hypothetical protein